jgi:phasin family protein
MADTEKSDAVKPDESDSAEKAYAAAAEAVEAKSVVDSPVEFPSKAKRGPKPRPAVAPIAAIPAAEPLPVEPPPIAAAPLAAKPAVARKPQVAKAKPVIKAPLPKAVKPLAAPRKPAPVPFTKPITTITKKPAIPQLKEKTMATQATDFTTDKFGGLKDVFSDVKTKAKAAFDKGTSSIGDATEFAKGNVEAVVESGKIYAAGLQELGSTYVAESKTAFEKLTADAKELAAQKSPTDFFKLQSEIARKNFDSAIAFGSKSSEAWMKLATDAFAPISGRVSLAVDKVKTAA